MTILICVDSGDSADIVLHDSLSFLKNISDIQIHVFTVVDMAMISVGRDDLDESRFMDMLEHQTAKLKASIALLMGEVKYTFSSEVGYPSDEILKKADTTNSDLLILGTHEHSALGHLLNTSIVEKVLRHVSCKTLVIPIKKKSAI